MCCFCQNVQQKNVQCEEWTGSDMKHETIYNCAHQNIFLDILFMLLDILHNKYKITFMCKITVVQNKMCTLFVCQKDRKIVLHSSTVAGHA